MRETLLSNEVTIRLGSFLAIFIVMAGWELLAPRRKLQQSRTVRWYSNLGITAINSLLLRIVFPILAVGLAVIAQGRNWGLFNNYQLPGWLTFTASLLMLDFIIYLQHVMFHKTPTFWLLHRMHHTDLDCDLTTGARFHPIEIILSMLIKLGVITIIGPPPVAVLTFEVVLNVCAMFNHGNVRIPVSIERYLRWILVTPDMHRIHHSIYPEETDSNFGFSVPWWDRLMGTYNRQPRDGHENMKIGIETFRDKKYLHLGRLLIQPFLTTD